MKSFIQSPLLALLLAGICHADAQTTQSIAVNNWFAINNKSGNTAYVQDGTTSSPIFKQVDGDASLFVFSYFDSQATLNDGESLSLTFDLTLALSEEGGTKTFDLVSYGLYKSVDLKASPSYSNIGADRTATTSQLSPFINGWGGFLIHKPSAQSHHHLRAYQKTPGASYNFASVSGTEPTYYSIPNTGSYKLDFTDGVARTFTLTYNRVGNDLHISGQLKGRPVVQHCL